MDGDLARIPLQLSNGNGEFTKTGIFFVSVTIGVDSLTHLEITAKDKVAVEFVDGNGILDLDDYGGVFFLPRSLTILNMPENTIRDSFQSVDVGGVAKALLDDIKIEDTTAVVPIVLNNGKEFNKSGTFYITLRVIIDSLNDIEITKDDFVICVFENGKGTLDLQNLYGYLGKGYLEGDITNKTNFAEAQVKKGTKFEMNGFFYHVITQAPMDNLYEISVISNTTVYIYAVEADSNVMNYKYVNAMKNADAFIRFRLSTVKPVYNAEKAGYYNGSDRALWKFIKMGGEWRYKTNIDDAFEIENQILSYPIGNLIYQWENVDIAPTKISLPPGIYCFEAAGAKGGDSAYYSMRFRLGNNDPFSKHNDIKGGDGGRIIELVSIETNKQITVYTGKAGANGSSPLSHTIIGEYNSIGSASSFGIPGGGGGAGSFISYDLGKPNDYFLCAGGGAGASGRVAACAFSTGDITSVKDISGGAGGSAGRGGDGGGIPIMTEVGHTERREYTSDGSTEYWDEYVVDYYYVSARINASAGGGLDGIGNLLFGKTLIDNVQTADMFLPSSPSNPSPMYQYGVPGVKVLLTSYLSTIGIGGAPKLPALAYYPHHKDFNITSFEGGAGGNNRNAVRGGNSGNGYVRIYSLN